MADGDAGTEIMSALADRILELDGIIAQDEDTYTFVEAMKNNNTKSKTRSDLTRVLDYFQSIGEDRQLLDIPPFELGPLLAKTFLNIRKRKDDTEYEPTTLKGIQSSVHRYLSDNQYEANILTDSIFKHSRDVISSKMKFLKATGLGNKKQRADPFTDEEIQILREKNLLGQETPESLINSIWLNNTIHFGLRGRQEHMTMLWGDVELQRTSAGVEFLAFTERSTKTRNGVASDPRRFLPKMFEEPGDDHCPVKLYKLYADKRPEEMQKPESRFYIAINPNYGKDVKCGSDWFINGPMGRNKLGQLAKIMSEKANLSGKHTNHSARKTSITKLLDANVAPTEVAQLSGHKNLSSLNHYNTVSLAKQQDMSKVLHNVKTCKSASSTARQVSTFISTTSCTESDEELALASQEIEAAFNTIQTYEHGAVELPANANVVDLPLVQNSDGSLSVGKRFNPEHLFSNCTFNAPVNIQFK